MKRLSASIWACFIVTTLCYSTDLESIHLSVQDTTIYVGQPLQLSFTTTPGDATYTKVSYASDNLNAVMVNRETGEISAFKEGDATITLTVNDIAGVIHTDECHVDVIYRDKGQCGDHLYYTLDYNHRLYFWADSVEGYKSNPQTHSYRMYDYGSPVEAMSATGIGPAPWYPYHDKISEIWLYNTDTIGDNAFRDITNVGVVRLYEGAALRDSVFLGCTRLNTIEQFDSIASPITGTSLLLDNATGREIKVILAPASTLPLFNADPLWNANGRIIMTNFGEWTENELYWDLSQSDTLGTLKLQVSRSWESESDSVFIPDMDTTGIRPPWHELREVVEDLVISDRIAYIGKNAFASLTGIQTVQVRQYSHTLDSIHYDAFSHAITPWKFAMGDPQDGPVLPPKVVGLPASGTLADNFSQLSVLYVPDSTFDYNGNAVKSADMYAAAPFWQNFRRITDRTVDSKDVTDESVQLKWLPLENAEGYLLTISKDDCNGCDTTVFIPATGGKGLVDWDNNTLPIYTVPSSVSPRRKPQGDDNHGGMTLVIEMEAGSGDAPHNDVVVSASKLPAESEYSYTREVVFKAGAVNPVYTKAGQFRTKETSDTDIDTIENTTDIRFPSAVFDITGRRLNLPAESLPNGIYLIHNGQTTTKILIQR